MIIFEFLGHDYVQHVYINLHQALMLVKYNLEFLALCHVSFRYVANTADTYKNCGRVSQGGLSQTKLK